MKKVFIFLISIFLISISVYGFLHFNGAKEEKPPKVVTDNNKKTEEEVEIYHVGEVYLFEKDDFVLSLNVISKTDDSFNGKLSAYYIEDLFKEVSVIDKKWDVFAKRNDDNKWKIRLSETKYDHYETEAVLKNDQIILKKLPILEQGEFTLSSLGIDSFNLESKIQEINYLYSTKKKRLTANQFLNTEYDNLSNMLDSVLSDYPINSDETLASKGRTRLYIHNEYLSELSRRIEEDFNSTEIKIVEITDYLKTKTPKNDAYFEDTVLKMFEELTLLTEENNAYLSSYTELVSIYELPSAERDSNLDLNDKKTKTMFDTMVKKYSRTNINIYNTTTNNLKINADKQYDIFLNKLNEK